MPVRRLPECSIDITIKGNNRRSRIEAHGKRGKDTAKCSICFEEKDDVVPLSYHWTGLFYSALLSLSPNPSVNPMIHQGSPERLTDPDLSTVRRVVFETMGPDKVKNTVGDPTEYAREASNFVLIKSKTLKIRELCDVLCF
jgi:hypothetical protein